MFLGVTGGAMARETARVGVIENVGEPARWAQRDRVLVAMAEIVAARGLRGASIAAVTKRAMVPRASFGELFGSTDECFLALLDWMLARSNAAIDEAAERESLWSDRVLAGLEALLVLLDSEPASARACLLETVAGPPQALASRARALERMRARLDEARAQLSLERQPPALTAEATIASVLGILRRRLLAGEAPPFIALLDQLVEVIVAAYLGPAAAAEAARLATQRSRALLEEHATRPRAPSVEIPKMLCHANASRLRACLLYLVDDPGASNQAVAAGIGISHPGQASALLARLERAGLLLKTPGRPGRPNAWSLSERGTEVTRVLYPDAPCT